jgi:hypothetical protein
VDAVDVEDGAAGKPPFAVCSDVCTRSRSILQRPAAATAPPTAPAAIKPAPAARLPQIAGTTRGSAASYRVFQHPRMAERDCRPEDEVQAELIF